MHELSLAEGIVAVALEKSGGRPVRRVLVRAGRSHHLDRDALEQGFRVAAQETEASTATLELEVVEGDRVLVDGVELETGWQYRPGAKERI